ncbi:hypothetical protein E2I00_009326 [Balaenoptera physalus]|uniref:5'-nucleotidase domain-containing protein 3 n=1 Tax=Balaenoptera physalus TaxID=9770 RepID=A0A643C9R2_BALPH|nr:hypothetical protein E2I00_009326 [Balaenoptera physalus]
MKPYLWERYWEAKRNTEELVTSVVSNLLNPDAIFSNNDRSLSDIEIYSFDYDYTLVFYSKHLHTLIFNAARDLPINEHRYPMEIRKYEYDPIFAIRGLHYDVQRSVLMKISAFHYIQLGTVYRGLSVVPDEKVIEIDIKDSVREVHTKGIMYRAVEADTEKYICYPAQTRAVLAKLADHGKRMFLITSSPSSFVDKGMRYIVGKDWRDLFDVVIVQAEKPNFFSDKWSPFRKVNVKGVLL